MRRYYGLVFWLAVRATTRLVWSLSRGALTIGLLATIFALALWLYVVPPITGQPPPGDVLSRAQIGAISTFLAVAAVLLVIFVWQLVRAPFLLWQTDQQTIAAQTKRLDNRDRWRSAVDGLVEFVEQGYALVQQIMSTRKRVGEDEYQAWERAAFEFLRSAYSASEASDFRVPGEPMNKGIMEAYETSVWKQRNRIMAQVETLQRIKNRYQEFLDRDDQAT